MSDNESKVEELSPIEVAVIDFLREGGVDKYFTNAKEIRKEANLRFDKIFPRILLVLIGFYVSIYYLVIDGKISADVLVAMISTVIGVIGTLFIQSKRTF